MVRLIGISITTILTFKVSLHKVTIMAAYPVGGWWLQPIAAGSRPEGTTPCSMSVHWKVPWPAVGKTCHLSVQILSIRPVEVGVARKLTKVEPSLPLCCGSQYANFSSFPGHHVFDLKVGRRMGEEGSIHTDVCVMYTFHTWCCPHGGREGRELFQPFPQRVSSGNGSNKKHS